MKNIVVLVSGGGTNNMGVGMVAVVAPEDAEKTIETLKANGVEAYKLGQLVESDEGVILN